MKVFSSLLNSHTKVLCGVLADDANVRIPPKNNFSAKDIYLFWSIMPKYFLLLVKVGIFYELSKSGKIAIMKSFPK